MKSRILWTLVTGFMCLAQLNAAANEKPLKVFILIGQSNMQGHAHVRTLNSMQSDPESETLLNLILDEQGTPRVHEKIWISSLSGNGARRGKLTTGFGADENKIGPELAFGICMQQRLSEPILIIKTAWGGKSLNTDFRSPGSGPYVFDDAALEGPRKRGEDIEKLKADRVAASGVYYRHALEHIQEVLSDIKRVCPDYNAEQGYELAGLVWFQGWNDMVDRGTYPNRNEPGGYDQYSEWLCQFIRDIRADLAAPQLPFVIGVLGVGGPTDQYGKSQQRYKAVHQNFRDAMAAPAYQDEFRGNVVAVLTEDHWDHELDSLVERDSEIRNRVKQREQAGQLDELISELTASSQLDDEQLSQLREARNQKQLAQRLVELLRSQSFTGKEYDLLMNGKSNAAYHYLGSARIITRIGQAFAEAMPLETRRP